MYPPPTPDDACFVLQQLDSIPRPSGDNEGDAINSDSVYYALEPHHQQIVDQAYTVVCAYRVMTNWYAMKLPIRLRRCDYPCGPK